jgi:hypothetical protein
VAAVCRQGIAEHLPAQLQQPGPDHPLGGFQAWQRIISQLPPTKGPFQPELSDCKRQFASEAVWAASPGASTLVCAREEN